MAQKIYIGFCKERKVEHEGRSWTELELSMNAADKELLKEHWDGGITLKVTRRKEVGNKGQTHSVYIDTWKPKKQDIDEDQGHVQPAPADDVPEYTHGADALMDDDLDDNSPF